jgi:hypothetical protein
MGLPTDNIGAAFTPSQQKKRGSTAVEETLGEGSNKRPRVEGAHVEELDEEQLSEQGEEVQGEGTKGGEEQGGEEQGGEEQGGEEQGGAKQGGEEQRVVKVSLIESIEIDLACSKLTVVYLLHVTISFRLIETPP